MTESDKKNLISKLESIVPSVSKYGDDAIKIIEAIESKPDSESIT